MFKLKNDPKSIQRRESLLVIFGGILSAVTLIASLYCVTAAIFNLDLNADVSYRISLVVTFLSLGISRGLMFFIRNSRINIIKNSVFGGIYIVIAIVLAFIDLNYVNVFPIVGLIFMLTVIANRICGIFETKSKRVFVFNIIVSSISTLIALLFALSFNSVEQAYALSLMLMLIIVVLSTIELLYFAFSRIKFKLLLKIIRKTFAAEILYGLILLIITFSFVFYITEDDIKTYGDGLWFSFATVTTIGFGDRTVTSTLSRVLAVFLGIYGIVVVAVITSIIVNFYNEVTKDEDKDIIEEEKQKYIENKEKEMAEYEKRHAAIEEKRKHKKDKKVVEEESKENSEE